MNNFKVFQIDTKIYLMKTIPLNEVYSEISSFVDTVLAKDDDMLELHLSTGYKNYVISGFSELETDKLYKEGKIYTFSIRTVGEELASFFNKKIGDGNTKSIKGLSATVKTIPKRAIKKIYSITPAIIKLENGGYWKGVIEPNQYEKRIIDNSIKKYQEIMETKIDNNYKFYDEIKFLNHRPIGSVYTKKGITLLGDKLELNIATDETAQNIAYMLLGTGILENNTRCFGYLNYKPL